MNTLHPGAYNKFSSLIYSLANAVFRQLSVVFRAHGSIIYFGNSRQLRMPVCTYWKFQEDTMFFVGSTENRNYQKKSWI